MNQPNRKELVERIVRRALQEWKARPRTSKPSGETIAHRIGHGLFEDMPPGTFKAKNSK